MKTVAIMDMPFRCRNDWHLIVTHFERKFDIISIVIHKAAYKDQELP